MIMLYGGCRGSKPPCTGYSRIVMMRESKRKVIQGREGGIRRRRIGMCALRHSDRVMEEEGGRKKEKIFFGTSSHPFVYPSFSILLHSFCYSYLLLTILQSYPLFILPTTHSSFPHIFHHSFLAAFLPSFLLVLQNISTNAFNLFSWISTVNYNHLHVTNYSQLKFSLKLQKVCMYVRTYVTRFRN